MMTPDEYHADLLGAQADPEMGGLLDDLDHLCTTATLPPRLRAAVDRAVFASLDQTVEQSQPRPGHWPASPARIRMSRPRRAWPAPRPARPSDRLPGLRGRLVALAGALALALSGVAGYLRVVSPTPVSAQVILQRVAAAAAHPVATPGQVVHEMSTVSTVLTLNHASPRDVTIDAWTQLDADGALVQQAATISATTTGALYTRLLRTQTGEQYYDPRGNDVTSETWSRHDSPADVQDPLGSARMAQLVQSAQRTSDRNIHLLPRQTLAGAPVDVVRIDHAISLSGAATAGAPSVPQLTLTLYVDPQSYAIRGLDLDESDGAGAATRVLSVRVTRVETLPLAAVPPQTFALHAPATAQVTPPSSAAAAPPTRIFSSVADILAQPDQPALLLSGDVAGLRFQGGGVMTQPGVAITSYGYGPDLQGPDTTGGPVGPDGLGSPSPTARSLSIQINHAAALDSSGTVPGAFTTRGAQPITVTIAGQPVQAEYWALETNAPALHQLSYQQGTAWILIMSQGLSKDEFFATLGALVDGRTHPAVVAQAQHELAVWHEEVTAAAAASVGLYGG